MSGTFWLDASGHNQGRFLVVEIVPPVENVKAQEVEREEDAARLVDADAHRHLGPLGPAPEPQVAVAGD